MRTVVDMVFGSHLYGTDTEQSDFDFKKVVVPSARDILLGRTKQSVKQSREKEHGERNQAGDVDTEIMSLHRYLELLSEGQTVALDMLFAPASSIKSDTVVWQTIWDNRDRLLTKKAAAFVGYCRQQANKYGIKGSRVAAARSALELSKQFDGHQKLGFYSDDIAKSLCEHASIDDIAMPSGVAVSHWNVCGRKMPYTSSAKNAQDILQRLVDEYGKRALAAETQNGIDWKALSHAVRVGHEAIELLTTAHITFPLRNRRHILDIKSGKLQYQEVSAEIEFLLTEIERHSAMSSLPEQPDREWIDDFVAVIYGFQVAKSPWTQNPERQKAESDGRKKNQI